MNPDLQRQRRNLILVSLWLLVFEFAQVKIGTVSVLGTELFVGSPRTLIVLSWLLWAYFFLRYYQYWRAENKRDIRDAFEYRMDSYANAFAAPKVLLNPAGQLTGFKIIKIGPLRWCYAHTKYNPNTGYAEQHNSPPLPNGRMLLWSIKSAFFTCLNTTHATDQILPFALGIAAPVVALARLVEPFIQSAA